MKVIIRREKKIDYKEVENLIREAFWNNYAPGCAEHYLVHIMRDCDDFISELDIVAVDEDADDIIIGNLMCVKSYISCDDNSAGDGDGKKEIITLGPIAVLPEYQNKGIGAMLLTCCKEKATELGYNAIILCGDPDYYSRHGFVPAEKYCIRNGENMFMDALQVCELKEGTLSGVSGIYIENSIYNIDPEKVNDFDKNFPPKEAIAGIKMQKRFEELAGKVKPFKFK